MNTSTVIPTLTPSDPTPDGTGHAGTVHPEPVRPGPAQLVRDSVYLLAGWPALLVGFIVCVVLLATGGSLLVLVVGLPILMAGLALARRLADLERRMQASLLDRELAAPLPARDADGSPWARAIGALRDPQRFADALFAVAGWTLPTLTWTVAFSWWAVILAGLSAPLWQRFVPRDDGTWDLADLLGLGESVLVHAATNVATGLCFLLAAPWVMRALAMAHSRWTSWLLVAPTRTARVEAMHRERAEAARAAEAHSLARLERDIHDGPQQRLVRLQMDLARVGRQWDRDPAAARRMLDEAALQAAGALDELRAATRGIAPPLLVDRGLAAALEELAGRAALPTTLTVTAPRINPGYETAIYFAVTEALTNAAKHSGAGHADVRVQVEGPWLVAEVEDDGVGGAHLGKGTGLAGLEQRLRGLGGRLEISSPTGGPTVIRAEVPCVS